MNQIITGKKTLGVLLVLLLTAAIFSAGCQTYNVGVSGVSEQKPAKGTSFVVRVRCDKNLIDGNCSKQMHEMIEHALAKKGWVLIDDKDHADVVVVADCDISGPQKRTKTEYVEKACPATFDYGAGPYDDDEFAVEQWNRCEEPVQVNYTVYTKSLVLRGYRGKKHSGSDKTPKQLWRVEARDTDEESKLGAMIPYLVSAAAKYAGENTNGFKIVRIPEGSRAIRQMQEAAE
ncbi:MAG: hypothetical protein KAR11_00450 [Phycisphaerae bacterium]|nr:hypothetical protein [Phycisphaerae bacterium]